HGPFRRMGWWYCSLSGPKRAGRLGTFGLRAWPDPDAMPFPPPAPWTTTLCFGGVQPGSSVDVLLAYDPRIVAGATAALALDDLERILRNEIVTEMRYFQALNAA